jgi:CubicO group peptidase (beta-lactamase class C family)
MPYLLLQGEPALLSLIAALALVVAPVPAGSARPAARLSDGLPSASPRAVGMSAQRLEAIDRVVARGVRAGGYPGASVVVGRKGMAVWQKGFGTLDWARSSAPVTSDRTIYDLASLTKVVGTTTAAMILYDEGKLELDAPVSKYLPAFTGDFKDAVTIRHLLTHRSGLPAGRDLWRIARNPQEARLAVIDTKLACLPGRCYEYSDLGYIILGMVVENAAGQELDRFLAERVFVPLGMTDTNFRPADSVRYRIAPTEVAAPRGYPVRGEVHDENAFALGGVAGHAGLFSTAADLSIFAQMMLNGGTYNGVRVLSDSAVRLFTRRAQGTRALGWDSCTGTGGCGNHLSDRAYGHTGFTGTSIWIDPDRDMFVVLLTNRVHAAKARRPAKVISDVRADLADLAALAVMDDPEGPLAMPASFRADKMSGWNRPEQAARSRRAGSRSARSRAAAAARSRAAKKSSSAKSAKSSRASASKTSSKAKSGKAVSAKSKASASKGTAKKTTAKQPTAKKSTSSKKRG